MLESEKYRELLPVFFFCLNDLSRYLEEKMKKFSVTSYYLQLLLYILITFGLSVLTAFLIAVLLGGGYMFLIAPILLFMIFPFGPWNFFFFLKALPQEQASRPVIWLGSILLLPLLSLAIYGIPNGFAYFIMGLPQSLYFVLGTILSHAVIYFLVYAIKSARSKAKQEMSL